jgi:hypothetical protein
VIACLPDGEDQDQLSDGCISVASIRDPVGEPTGLFFDPTGRVAYLVIQHGQSPASLLDFASNPVDGRTDDLLRISGFDVFNSSPPYETIRSSAPDRRVPPVPSSPPSSCRGGVLTALARSRARGPSLQRSVKHVGGKAAKDRRAKRPKPLAPNRPR